MVATAPRYWWWWRGQGGMGGGFMPPVRSLVLSDFDRAGLTLTGVLALMVADRTADEVFDSVNGQGSLIDGSLELTADAIINRVRETSSGGLATLNRGGSAGLSTLFADDGMFPDSVLHIQTLDGRANIPFQSAGTAFVRFSPSDNDSILDDIANLDRFIIAISYTPTGPVYSLFWPGLGAMEGIDWPGESTPIAWPGI